MLLGLGAMPSRDATQNVAGHKVRAGNAAPAIPEREWQKFRDGEIAETVHCRDKTEKAFRLIVPRRSQQQDS